MFEFFFMKQLIFKENLTLSVFSSSQMENSHWELIVFHFLEFVRKEKKKKVSFRAIGFATQKKLILIIDFHF